MGKDFSLSVEAPPQRYHNSIYNNVIDEFIDAVLDNPKVATKSARVEMPGRAVKTVQVGLAKAVKQSGRKIMVSIRNGEMWLIAK